MADAGDGLPLKGGGGGVEGPGGAEKDVAPLALPQAGQQKGGQHAGAAAAAGAAAVDVLTAGVEDQQAAVSVVGQRYPVPLRQPSQQVAAQPPQIAGDDQVIEVRAAAGVLHVSAYGVPGGGG